MDCDARRQLLIRDLDGSFTGHEGSAIISMAEFQWDGDRRFGLGTNSINVLDPLIAFTLLRTIVQCTV